VKSLFEEVGLAGAGVILIIVGIVFDISDISPWAAFCITLGISALALVGVKESKGITRIIVGVVCAGCFVASIVILLTSLHS